MADQLVRCSKSLETLEEQLKNLADMASSLEPLEAKESSREVMLSLSALEQDLTAGDSDPELVQKLKKRLADATTKASRIRATASNKHAQVGAILIRLVGILRFIE